MLSAKWFKKLKRVNRVQSNKYLQRYNCPRAFGSRFPESYNDLVSVVYSGSI